MRSLLKLTALLILITHSSTQIFAANQYPLKKILVAVQGNSQLNNLAMGDGRQLAQLLGHFNTSTKVIGVDDYTSNDIENHDYIFYIGFYSDNKVPDSFLSDIIKTEKKIIWINTGFAEFSKKYNVASRFGFTVSKLDTITGFDYVKFDDKIFTKGEGNINLIDFSNYENVVILATAYSSKYKKEVPYILSSSNLLYIADSPFAYASSRDRYLLFADMLHDILNELHEEARNAIVRIEDVTPLDSPDKIRDITDYLSASGIPFLISVVPFYVDPVADTRVSLSDKPDMADALRYAEKNGGTIVMHGITHQYKDVTASDYEFWDANMNLPIQKENEVTIMRKIEMGIDEFAKNGIQPLLWETPHYTASNLLYSTISNYFSTAIEQRLSIENPDYSQFFPYVIYRDLYGQKIYPENLGYIPEQADENIVKRAVEEIINGAKANLNVRDGYASFFFHSFLDISILKKLVEEIENLGYTFINIREELNSVRSKKHLIISGSQKINLDVADQYLVETHFNVNGNITSKRTSEKRITGKISKQINLKPGGIYKAELKEFLISEPGFISKLLNNTKSTFKKIVSPGDDYLIPKIVIIWDHYARGAAYNDQASLAAVFRSVNINVDTIYVKQKINLDNYNLLIVPYTSVEYLKPDDYDIITGFVKNGGNIITDTKNYLSEELGIKYSSSQLSVNGIRDYYYQDERIVWKDDELITRFETKDVEEIFCYDIATEFPMIIGKKYGSGKVIYISSQFDPHTQLGYSHYPYLLEYVRKYFNIKPFVKKNNLEVYFDPGYRNKVSIEKLIRQWVKQGIKTIYVAGWHQYPKYTYDYKKLIELSHSNGILVYAWLELPQVSHKFWLENPQWREKNYLGQDIRASWRYPVALTDQNCLLAVKKEVKKFLQRYDWDGVNLAELYFEAGRGFEDPHLYTPMHISAQKEVWEKFKFDLVKIFDPSSNLYWKKNNEVKKNITDYRVDKLNKIYNELLALLENIADSRKDFRIILTAMDSYGSPELREYIGEDMDNILKLQSKYGFILQVQDPQSVWSTDPTRYENIGKFYQTKIKDQKKLMLDINILNFRSENDITPFPTLIQTGTESFYLVKSASLGAPRVAIYSESSINPQDLYYMPFALAADVNYYLTDEGINYSSKSSFIIELPEKYTQIKLDGKNIYPGRGNSFIVPAGNHNVKFSEQNGTFDSKELQTKILSFNANLLSINYGNQDLSFVYESETSAIISLNGIPASIKLDGENYDITILKGDDCISVLLPSGKHNAEFIVGDFFSKGISLTSLWSSTSIALFGILSISLLVIIYVIVKYLKHNVNQKRIKL